MTTSLDTTLVASHALIAELLDHQYSLLWYNMRSSLTRARATS